MYLKSSLNFLKIPSCFITATQLRYRYIDLLSNATQFNALHVKETFLQCLNAAVGEETEIRALQLTATQMQESMNEAL